METLYLIAGKRFQARDTADLNQQLAKYNLISNLREGRESDLSVRRLAEPQGTSRYGIVETSQYPSEIFEYDVIVGKNIGIADPGDVVESELSELEIALSEVRIDIPDAKIIAGLEEDGS